MEVFEVHAPAVEKLVVGLRFDRFNFLNIVLRKVLKTLHVLPVLIDAQNKLGPSTPRRQFWRSSLQCLTRLLRYFLIINSGLNFL